MKKITGAGLFLILFYFLPFTNYHLPITSCYAEPLYIDRFEKDASNSLGGRVSTYEQAPSRAMAANTDRDRLGSAGKSLIIRYDKKNTGGPNGEGGWCGYYSILKVGLKYFDASRYSKITFWVKGEKGGENFKIGLADRHWEQIGDSVKSEEIGAYLSPKKGVTTEWQKATVPLSLFFIDIRELASVSVCFESDCFPDGKGSGTIYIDDLAFE